MSSLLLSFAANRQAVSPVRTTIHGNPHLSILPYVVFSRGMCVCAICRRNVTDRPAPRELCGCVVWVWCRLVCVCVRGVNLSARCSVPRCVRDLWKRLTCWKEGVHTHYHLPRYLGRVPRWVLRLEQGVALWADSATYTKTGAVTGVGALALSPNRMPSSLTEALVTDQSVVQTHLELSRCYA